MLIKTIKISKKGQVTIPKIIRGKLGSDLISFVIEKDEIKIVSADKETYGKLRKYAKRYIPIKEAREIAWKNIKDE